MSPTYNRNLELGSPPPLETIQKSLPFDARKGDHNGVGIRLLLLLTSGT